MEAGVYRGGSAARKDISTAMLMSQSRQDFNITVMRQSKEVGQRTKQLMFWLKHSTTECLQARWNSCQRLDPSETVVSRKETNDEAQEAER